MKARIVVRQRWWLKWYLVGISAALTITGLEPDPERITYWVGRGTKIEVIHMALDTNSSKGVTSLGWIGFAVIALALAAFSFV